MLPNEELEEPQEIKCYKAEAAIEPQINTNVESLLLVFLFVFINCFVPRDHRQITFVALNRFCLLRKAFHPLFLMDNIKLDGIPSKIKRKYTLVLNCISSFKGTSYKKFVFVLLFYISRYHFLQLFKTSFNII